jgi:hypothetical protein
MTLYLGRTGSTVGTSGYDTTWHTLNDDYGSLNGKLSSENSLMQTRVSESEVNDRWCMISAHIEDVFALVDSWLRKP